MITASFQLPFSFSKGEKDEMKLTAVTRNPVHSCPTLFFLFLFTVLQFFFFCNYCEKEFVWSDENIYVLLCPLWVVLSDGSLNYHDSCTICMHDGFVCCVMKLT